MTLMDNARRQIGAAFDAVGLGPQEAAYRVVTELPGARLRAYFDREDSSGPVLFIIPAPFKRPYIWDLMPEVSAVRCCLRRGYRVYLLDWLVPTNREDGFGLADYADRLPSSAMEAIERETGSCTPILAGHSLGGTFAAIFATLHPERIGGLLLIDAPLVFGEDGGPFAAAARASPPARIVRELVGSPVPGSVINALSVAAAPDAFQGQRVADLAASLLDPKALAIHTRVERWTYDEFPMPGRLFDELVEQLYREDRFRNGTLQVGERQTGLAKLQCRVLAVVNPIGRVVPPRSVLAGLDAASNVSVDVLEYKADRGPMLQHLGPLVAPLSHEQLWPKILDWIGQLGTSAQPPSRATNQVRTRNRTNRSRTGRKPAPTPSAE
jgi:poly[(R)-3-hydroxyalkanoate] polymerase subunit PhaC